MTGEPALGAFVFAVFPGLANKRRLGVFVQSAPLGARRFALAVPATAEPGDRPGALHAPRPPAPGLKPCWILVRAMAVLPLHRLEPLGAQMETEAQAALRSMIAEWFGADFGPDERALRKALARGGRLAPRTAQSRRRGGSGDKPCGVRL